MPEEEYETETTEEESPVITTLRAEEKAAKKAAADAQRELAFLKAGIDTDAPMAKFFADNYSGELQAEAVKSAAIEIGLIQDDTPVVEPEEGARQQEAREQLTGGAPPETDEPYVDPRVEGLQRYDERRQVGVPADVASGEYFDRVIDAAIKGDANAVYDPDRWRDQFGQTGYKRPQ